jgi:hypothetical protein
MLGGAGTINERIKPLPIVCNHSYSATVGVVSDVALHHAQLGSRDTTNLGSRFRLSATRGVIDDEPRALARDTYGGCGAQFINPACFNPFARARRDFLTRRTAAPR